MSRHSRDLTIEEVLADPVIGAALRADRVDPRGFETLLRTTARRLDDSRHVSGLCASLAGKVGCASAGTRAAW